MTPSNTSLPGHVRRYILDTTWFEEWKRYCNYDEDGEAKGPGGPPPGPISNVGLVQPGSGWRARAPQLRGDVREDSDYQFVNSRMWGLLHGWYGGGPEMPRSCYAEDEFGTSVKVETRPQPCVVFVPGEPTEDGTETVEPLVDDAPIEAIAAEDDAHGVGGGAGGGAGGGDGDVDAEIEGSKLDESDLPENIVAMLISRRATVGAAKEEFCKKAAKDPITSRLWVFVRPPGGEDPAAGEWQVVHDGQPIGEVARNDAFTKFIVDTEEDGKWGRKAPDDERKTTVVTDIPAWRAALKVGDRLDAQDGQDKWYESEIVEVNTYNPKDPDRRPSYKVHFRAWESRWDSYIAMDSERLQPAWTKIKNFRDFRVTDKLEVKLPPTADARSVKGGKWFPCRVESFDEEQGTVTVKVTSKYRQDVKTFNTDSALLCPFPTHCSKSEIAASSYAPLSYSSSRSNRGGWNNWRTHTRGRPAADGAVGLVNLGNTCFMNSMLQCLSNTAPLTNYFLHEEWAKDVNKTNPLGMGGRLAEAYAGMLEAIWGGEYSVVCPSDVKENIGQHAPQFAGYQQQDSQELMNFLLDGLHEDLNRVKKKPYVEKVEGNGRPDDEVAKEAWEGHLARNKSAVLDIFAGQLRSEVQCDVCPKESVTFDPFLSFSVPVPHSVTRPIIFTIYPYDGGIPTQYRPALPMDGQIRDMKKWLHEAEGVHPDELVLCPLLRSRLDDFFRDSDGLQRIRARDVCVGFRVPRLEAAPEDTKDEETKEPEKRRGVFSRVKDAIFGAGGAGDASEPHDANHEGLIQVCFRKPVPAGRYTTRAEKQPFGEPRVVSLFAASSVAGEMPTNNEVHNEVWGRVHRLFAGEWSAESPPYTLSVAPRGLYYPSAEIPRDDEPFSLGSGTSGPVLVCDVSEENYRDAWDDEAYKSCIHYKEADKKKKSEVLTLDKCLEKAFEREQLAETDKWYCPDCKEHRTAFKKFDLWRTPEVLVLHLKRFQYRQGYMNFVSRSKIDCLVDFPEELDVAKYVVGPREGGTVYELYAVSNHMGGMGGGHYTAYAKNFRNGQWYTLDDSHVSETSVSRVVTPSAYVLFYQKKKGAGGAAPAREIGPVDPAEEGEADDGHGAGGAGGEPARTATE